MGPALLIAHILVENCNFKGAGMRDGEGKVMIG